MALFSANDHITYDSIEQFTRRVMHIRVGHSRITCHIRSFEFLTSKNGAKPKLGAGNHWSWLRKLPRARHRHGLKRPKLGLHGNTAIGPSHFEPDYGGTLSPQAPPKELPKPGLSKSRYRSVGCAMDAARMLARLSGMIPSGIDSDQRRGIR